MSGREGVPWRLARDVVGASALAPSTSLPTTIGASTLQPVTSRGPFRLVPEPEGRAGCVKNLGAPATNNEEEEGSQVARDEVREMAEMCGKICGADGEAENMLIEQESSGDRLVDDIRSFITSVKTKPSLYTGSASFVRDHLRTILAISSQRAEWEISQSNRRREGPSLNDVDDSTARCVLERLSGRDRLVFGTVSRRWYRLTQDPELWKDLCLERCRSLETDDALWTLLGVDGTSDQRWRLVYAKLLRAPTWRFALNKPGKFLCNLVAFVVKNSSLAQRALPTSLTVLRRFNQIYIKDFCLPETCTLYFEPETQADEDGYNGFVQYLSQRKRAGLTYDHVNLNHGNLNYVFIPPCEQARNQLNYSGSRLTGLILPPESINPEWMS